MTQRNLGIMAAAAALALGNGGPDYYDGYGFRKGPKPNKYKPRENVAGRTHNAEQINAMAAKFGHSAVARQEPDPHSITSIKLKHHVHRSVARKMKESGEY